MKVKATEKRYFTIGEVAKRFNVKPSLIRFWESEFAILNPKKNNRGIRKFSSKDIDNIKEIYFLLKEKKYKISGAKKFFKNKRFNKNFEVVNKLNNIKEKLIEIRDQL